MNLWGKLKEIEREKPENTETRAIFTPQARDTPHLF